MSCLKPNQRCQTGYVALVKTVTVWELNSECIMHVPILMYMWFVLFISRKQLQMLCNIFTARRYAKRGICRRRVSVCLCVCVYHTPVLYQNG